MASKKEPEDYTPGRNDLPEVRKISALDRMLLQALGDGKSVGADDDPVAEQFPNVWDWMSRCYFGKDRDKLRMPSPLTIRLTPTGCIAQLVDRDLCVTCTVSFPHIMDALAALETALTSPNPPLTFWGRNEPRVRKRGPRS